VPKGRSNGGRPTMRDVAREAGVSKALVSIVFRGVAGASEDTRARVFSAADQLGYRPNRTASLLAMSRTRQLGVVMNLHNSFHAEVVDAAVTEAASYGYRLVLSPWTASQTEERAIDTALEFRCEALLLLGSSLSAEDILRLVGDIPISSVGRHIELGNVDVVRGAEESGMEQVVDHLVALGHRRIAHVDGGSDEIAAARRAGFQGGARRHGLLSRSTVTSGGRTEHDGRRATHELLRRSEVPTAIAAFNDHCAIGVIDALTTAGMRVPSDVAVTGYDDSSFAKLHAIDLTSVHQDAGEFALWAVTAAVERLDGGRTRPRKSVLEPRLVARGTSGPPPSH
jgi:DNA-binding LacI/PurR family transcriptional regulator